MPEAHPVRETRANRPCPSEIRLIAQGLDVSTSGSPSSQSTLTSSSLDIFDEYARRQYVAKAPQRNPFGIDEEPKKFNDMDTFAKIRILQQLSTWTLNNPDRIREKMPEQKDVEQTAWVSGVAQPHSRVVLMQTSASIRSDGIKKTAPTSFLMTIVYIAALILLYPPTHHPSPSPGRSPS